MREHPIGYQAMCGWMEHREKSYTTEGRTNSHSIEGKTDGVKEGLLKGCLMEGRLLMDR